MKRIALAAAFAAVAAISFAQDSATGTAGSGAVTSTGSNNADLRTNNASTTGTMHGTGTAGHPNRAGKAGRAHGTGTMKNQDKGTSSTSTSGM